MSIQPKTTVALAALVLSACAANPERMETAETNTSAMEPAETTETMEPAQPTEEEQYRADMELMCAEPPASVMETTPENRASSIATYWSENTSSDGAGRLMEALGNAAPESKADMMTFAAKEAGLESCPFGEKLFAPVEAPTTGGGGAEEGSLAESVGAEEGSAPTASGEMIAGSLEVEGDLSKDVIRRVIRNQRNKFRYCYEKELTKDPKLAGKVVLSFTIGPDGTVSASSVKETTIGSAAVETCVANAMKRTVFPKPSPEGSVLVTYPFIFQAK